MFDPDAAPKVAYAESVMNGHDGPAIAATDYVRLYAESIRPYLGNRRYVTLGTDGYGRSDTRRKLREFFEVDRRYVAIAALHALAQDGKIEKRAVANAVKKYGIDPSKPHPVLV